MKWIITLLCLSFLIGCTTTQTQPFGHVARGAGIQEFTDIEVSDHFILSPADIISKYETTEVGYYFTHFYVDDRYYYLVASPGIESFGIPETSATVIIDGWTGAVIKGLSKPSESLATESEQ